MAKIDEYPFGKLTIQLHAVTTDPRHIRTSLRTSRPISISWASAPPSTHLTRQVS
jgi:hypothetical protein